MGGLFRKRLRVMTSHVKRTWVVWRDKSVSSKHKNIDPSKIKHKRQHVEFTDAQTAKIRAAWALIKDSGYFPGFERFEDGFLYDANPDREIEVWTAVGESYAAIKRTAADKFLAFPDESKKMLVVALVC